MAHMHHEGGRETLNLRLIKKQNRTEEDINKIVVLHEELHKVFDEMETETDNKRLQNLAVVVAEIEFELQEAWGFERNADHHSWWFRVPHCTCPKLDNWDYVGTGLRITMGDCPIHMPSLE